jgi:hypothetical protein
MVPLKSTHSFCSSGRPAKGAFSRVDGPASAKKLFLSFGECVRMSGDCDDDATCLYDDNTALYARVPASTHDYAMPQYWAQRYAAEASTSIAHIAPAYDWCDTAMMSYSVCARPR